MLSLLKNCYEHIYSEAYVTTQKKKKKKFIFSIVFKRHKNQYAKKVSSLKIPPILRDVNVKEKNV